VPLRIFRHKTPILAQVADVYLSKRGLKYTKQKVVDINPGFRGEQWLKLGGVVSVRQLST
jgi:hypothetical protein